MASSFSTLPIWDRVGDRLSWYVAVAADRMPAKFQLSRRVPCRLLPSAATLDELWAEHGRETVRFLEVWRGVRQRKIRMSELTPANPSLLDLEGELVTRMLSRCAFCRWNCRVDRTLGERHGTCQLEESSRVASYFDHHGEELVFRGDRGSGTVFFTSCNMRCQFCQNGDISHDKDNGVLVTPREVAQMALRLGRMGCHNINWVGGEPTVHLHTIVEAIRVLGDLPAPKEIDSARRRSPGARRVQRWSGEPGVYDGEFNVPMLWNSNFFMSLETMQILRPIVDVWLSDFKFGNDRCAVSLSRTPWYFETVATNHKLVYDWGEDLVIRHLVMPGHVECCTKPILDWIAQNTPQALVNVMDQYRPEYACDRFSPRYDDRYRTLARHPDPSEILEAYTYARNLGLRFEDLSIEKRSAGVPA